MEKGENPPPPKRMVKKGGENRMEDQNERNITKFSRKCLEEIQEGKSGCVKITELLVRTCLTLIISKRS
jgi:hypothetical protein